VLSHMRAFRHMVERELQYQKFWYMTPDEAKWFEADEEFGPFSTLGAPTFPSAREDMKEAKNCYVLGRHTAAVFHAMRVLEYGLKALADDVGIT